ASDGRAYPWGDAWDAEACAHRDYGPRCTLAAGICPRGTGPTGIRDLCGNVWQWTSDERPDGARVVCGGAWNNLPWMIGCGARNGYPPDARFSNLGLRLAFDP